MGLYKALPVVIALGLGSGCATMGSNRGYLFGEPRVEQNYGNKKTERVLKDRDGHDFAKLTEYDDGNNGSIDWVGCEIFGVKKTKKFLDPRSEFRVTEERPIYTNKGIDFDILLKDRDGDSVADSITVRKYNRNDFYRGDHTSSQWVFADLKNGKISGGFVQYSHGKVVSGADEVVWVLKDWGIMQYLDPEISIPHILDDACNKIENAQGKR